MARAINALRSLDRRGRTVLGFFLLATAVLGLTSGACIGFVRMAMIDFWRFVDIGQNPLLFAAGMCAWMIALVALLFLGEKAASHLTRCSQLSSRSSEGLRDSLGYLSATLGVIVAAATAAQPARLGEGQRLTESSAPEIWGVSQWIAWASPLWIIAILLIVAMVRFSAVRERSPQSEAR